MSKLPDTPIIKNYTPYIGDTFGRSFKIKTNGDLADLSADTLRMRIQDAVTGEEFETLTLGSGIENPTTGRVVWTLTPAQTATFIANRKYKYDIQWTRSDGTNKTVQRGIMVPWQDVTPAV